MYSRTVYTIDELPLSGTHFHSFLEKDRKTTDVFCCFLGILVPLTMLVLAFGNLNTGTRVALPSELPAESEADKLEQPPLL